MALLIVVLGVDDDDEMVDLGFGFDFAFSLLVGLVFEPGMVEERLVGWQWIEKQSRTVERCRDDEWKLEVMEKRPFTAETPYLRSPYGQQQWHNFFILKCPISNFI